MSADWLGFVSLPLFPILSCKIKWADHGYEQDKTANDYCIHFSPVLSLENQIFAISKSQSPNFFLITTQRYRNYSKHNISIRNHSNTPHQRLTLKGMDTEQLIQLIREAAGTLTGRIPIAWWYCARHSYLWKASKAVGMREEALPAVTLRNHIFSE